MSSTLTASQSLLAVTCPVLLFYWKQRAQQVSRKGCVSCAPLGCGGSPPFPAVLPIAWAVLAACVFAVFYPSQAVIWKQEGCALAVLKIRNSKFPQNLTKERVISRWADGKDCSHSCGMCVLGHFSTNTCPFFSWCACVWAAGAYYARPRLFKFKTKNKAARGRQIMTNININCNLIPGSVWSLLWYPGI